jgi:hypothetical protein
MKININGINREAKLLKKNEIIRNRRNWFKKVFIYSFLAAFPVLYGLYILKASGLFKLLKLDERYKERVKRKEQEFNIDQEKYDKMISEFEKKYDINYSTIEYEKRMKYGNKEMNKREPEEVKEVEEIIQPKNSEIKIEEKNLDPTKLGTSIIFHRKLK